MQGGWISPDSIQERDEHVVFMKAGQRINQWTLDALLGEGGNAAVWRAVDDTGKRVALKVLRVRNPEAEPYRRFRDEVAILRRMGESPGVLPLIDARLPEHPSGREAAWLAMPEATPIRKALGAAELETVVTAMASVASTLASLAEERIFHRDLKPENLYQHEETWAVGDFGLVDFPDKEALTEAGRKLGPAWYIAPEMLARPESAEGGPADVYSFAKTLWVLATGQRYPIPGEQRQDTPGGRISDYVQHPEVALLDRLLAEMTRLDPAQRPTMPEVARELHHWVRLSSPEEPSKPRELDLAELDARIGTVFAPVREADRRRRESGRAWQEAARALENAVSDAQRWFEARELPWSGPRKGSGPGSLGSYMPRYLGDTGKLWNMNWEVAVEGPPPQNITLRVAAAVAAYDDGTIEVAAAHLVGHHGLVQDQLWAVSGTVPAGSAEQQLLLAKAVDELVGELPRSMENFVHRIESAT